MAKEEKPQEEATTTDLAAGITVGGVPVAKVVGALLKTGGVGGAMIGLLLMGWAMLNRVDKLSSRFDQLTTNVSNVDKTLTKVTTTLELASPAEVRDELHKMRQTMATKLDLEKNAPWKRVEAEWQRWRQEIDRRVLALERHRKGSEP